MLLVTFLLSCGGPSVTPDTCDSIYLPEPPSSAPEGPLTFDASFHFCSTEFSNNYLWLGVQNLTTGIYEYEDWQIPYNTTDGGYTFTHLFNQIGRYVVSVGAGLQSKKPYGGTTSIQTCVSSRYEIEITESSTHYFKVLQLETTDNHLWPTNTDPFYSGENKRNTCFTYTNTTIYVTKTISNLTITNNDVVTPLALFNWTITKAGGDINSGNCNLDPNTAILCAIDDLTFEPSNVVGYTQQRFYGSPD